MSRAGTPRDQALARLGDLARAGVDGLSRVGRRTATEPAATGKSVVKSKPPAASVAAQEPAGAAVDSWASLDLTGLGGFLADCRRCGLCAERTQVVFGVGAPRARLMFVGEGPGREEDLRGEPFVGRAGQLLTEMIEKGMGIARQDVYIANVVKCRPPGNRDPLPDEVAACDPFLRRQVALVRPEVIVALGRVAAQSLLRTTRRIGELRGEWHEFEGTPLLPTFHPAYLLRNPQEKRVAWADLKLVMARLGLPPRK